VPTATKQKGSKFSAAIITKTISSLPELLEERPIHNQYGTGLKEVGHAALLHGSGYGFIKFIKTKTRQKSVR